MISKPMESIHPIHHLSHFSPDQLNWLLERQGFELLSLRRCDVPLSLIEGGPAKKAVLACLYAASRLLSMQWEVIVVARKKAESGKT